MAAVAGVWSRVHERFEDAVGGPARRRVVVLLALVLALNSADTATIGAVAAELQSDLDITNLQLGVLASVSLAVAGLATVPIGVLADRIRRMPVLEISILLWSAAMIVTGAATSFVWLLLARLALGAVAATAGPTIASLIGDLFPPSERGRIYGFVLTGELIGAGFGFVVSGMITAALSWRWGFWVLVPPGLALVWALHRWLPEPARGGASRIGEGDEEIVADDELDGHAAPERDEDDSPELTIAQEVVEEHDIEPEEDMILEGDPQKMSLRKAASYVLRLRTNRVLIIASALGWFFFAGVRTFGLIFLRGHFGVSQAAATALLVVVGLGALVGVLIGGRISDRLLRRGRLNARVGVAVVGYGLTPLLIAPGIVSTTLWFSIPLFFAGTASLGAANPPADAGRLDVMHHRLWGRAEAVRTVARTWAEASAPIIVGWLSQQLGNAHGGSPFAAEGAASTHGQLAAATQGLQYAFLIMLVPLVVGALIGLRALSSYPRDVATAAASEERTSS